MSQSQSGREVLYHQPYQAGLAGIFKQMDTRANGQMHEGLNVYYWDTVFQNRPTYIDKLVTGPISSLTGFTPQPCFVSSCYGTQVASSFDLSASAVQADGNEIGIVIDSNSLLNPHNTVGATQGLPSGPIPIMIQYVFPTANGRPRPFAGPGKTLTASVDLQVPYSRTNGGSSNQIVLYFGMLERRTGRVIAYGAQAWDSRGNIFKNNSDAYIAFDSCEAPLTCTGSPMLVAPINSAGKFNRAVAGSHNLQETTWTGYRRFSFSIGEANFRATLEALNARLASPTSDRLSMDLADYEIRDFSVDSEVEYVADGRSAAAMGYSARNLEIVVENTASEVTPFVQYYNSSNGLHAFIPDATSVAGAASYPGFSPTNVIGYLHRNFDNSQLVPIHQFLRPNLDFFFVPNAGENAIRDMVAMGYVHSGIVGYGYAAGGAGRKAVLSLWNHNESRHFFSSDFSPDSYWVKLPAFGWQQESERFYVE